MRYLYTKIKLLPTPISVIASKFVYASRHARWTNTVPDTCTDVRVDHIVHTATLRLDIRGKHGPAPVSAWPIARESDQFPASWSDCHFTTRVPVRSYQSPAFRPERVYPPKSDVVARPNRRAYGPYPSTVPYVSADNIRYRVLRIQHNLTDWRGNPPEGSCWLLSGGLGLCDRRFNPTRISTSSMQCILTRI